MRREPTRKREREDNGDEQDIESSTPPPARKRKRRADAEYPSPPSDSGKYHIVGNTNNNLYWHFLSLLPARMQVTRINYFYSCSKVHACCVCFSHADDEHNYDANVTEICGGPTRNQLRKLMKKTYKLRRKWILDEAPAVSTILSKFPCLKEAKYVNVYG